MFIKTVDFTKIHCVKKGSKVLLANSILGSEIFSWDTRLLPDGTYLVLLSVADLNGEVSVDNKTVTVANNSPSSNQKPSLSLTAPSAYNAKTVSFSAGVLDTDLSSYSLTILNTAGEFISGTGTIPLSSGFTTKQVYTWDSRTALDGVYTVTISAKAKKLSPTSVPEIVTEAS
jgi:hypothetical protein